MIKLLLKNRFLGILGSMLGKNKSGKGGAGRVALFVVLYAYLGFALLFLSVTMSLSLAASFLPVGLDWFYYAVFMLAGMTVLFVLSIFETKSELFDCKDNDLLLSMPIPEGALVVSRISVVLTVNYIVEAFIMLPAIVFYAIFSGNILGIIGGIISFLLIPLFATSLASFAGYLVALVSRKVKRKTLLTLVLSLGFLALYFVGYGALMGGMDSVIEGTLNPELIAKRFSGLKLIGDAVLLRPLNFTAFLLLSLGVSFVAYLFISKNYFKIATDKGSAKKSEYRERTLESRGALRALLSNEMGRFTSSATYMMNAGLGLIFTVVLSVMALVNKDSLFLGLSQMFPGGDVSSFISPIMVCAIVILSSMTMMSASALSLEGKNLWIPKSIPVQDSTVLLSKILPQILISAPVSLLSSVLMIIAAEAKPIYWIFFILIPLLANIAFALLGLIFNILFPRFDFENEAQPVKQSMSVFLTMMSQMIFSFILLIVNFAFALLGLGLTALIVSFLLIAAITSVLGVILFIPCKKKYSKITL